MGKWLGKTLKHFIFRLKVCEHVKAFCRNCYICINKRFAVTEIEITKYTAKMTRIHVVCLKQVIL